VHKIREVYNLAYSGRFVTITLDHVETLGYFVEIERIIFGESEIQQAQEDIQFIGRLLELTEIESRSYLGLLLSKPSA